MAESDFPWLGSNALVLREQAAKTLRSFVEGDAELLSLSCNGAKLWLLHVLRVIDALVESESDVVRSSDGGVMMVTRHVFRPAVVGEARIFKVPQLTRSAHFVTQAVVETVQSAGLRGLDFELRWTSEAHD